jgi:hypothetical protein
MLFKRNLNSNRKTSARYLRDARVRCRFDQTMFHGRTLFNVILYVACPLKIQKVQIKKIRTKFLETPTH